MRRIFCSFVVLAMLAGCASNVRYNPEHLRQSDVQETFDVTIDTMSEHSGDTPAEDMVEFHCTKNVEGIASLFPYSFKCPAFNKMLYKAGDRLLVTQCKHCSKNGWGCRNLLKIEKVEKGKE